MRAWLAGGVPRGALPGRPRRARARPAGLRQPLEISSQDLARAVRLLVVRSRREATGLFAGNYASAFRGGGLEFEEARPYVPGDDVRTIDWNATARHGEVFVKRYREERDQTLLLALDSSASMRFGSAGRSKAATAAHAIALLCAAAGRAGDRVGLVAFAEAPRERVPPGRGAAHGSRVVRSALAAAAGSAGGTRIEAGLRALRAQTRRRGVVVLLSDFRDEGLLSHPSGPRGDGLAELARRHDVVAGVLVDPLELRVPRVGVLCLEDPERPGRRLVLDTGARRSRRRYLAACAERRARVAALLRRAGAEVLWLRTDQSPLQALGHFFERRAGRRQRGAA